MKTHLEKAIFVTGIVLAAVVVIEAMIAWRVAPWGEALIRGLVAELLAGREAGVPVALAGGVPPLVVWQMSATQDLATAFLAFPVVLVFIHRMERRDNWLGRRLTRIEEAAAEHQAYLRKWGPLGVFLFMQVPFLVNGPFIALTAGRVAGIRTWYLLAPVILGTIVAAAAWTYLFDTLIGVTNAIHPMAGWIIAWLMVTIVGVLALVDFVRNK